MEQMLAGGLPGETLLVLAPQRTLLAPYEQALRQPGTAPGGLPALLTVGGLAQRMVNLVLAFSVRSLRFCPARIARRSS